MICTCIICGIKIVKNLPYGQKWLREFRILYREDDVSYISGVGYCFAVNTWVAPRDPSKRWNTKKEGDLTFNLTLETSNTTLTYFIHETCWCILQMASHPVQIDVESLISVCESASISYRHNTLNWGHDYGGFLTHDVTTHYPWMECFREPRDAELQKLGAQVDPCDQKNFDFLHLCAPTNLTKKFASCIEYQAHPTDCFAKLPLELLEMIVIPLSTADFLNLRYVSRSLRSLILSSGFWVSRFRPDRERGFAWEVLDEVMEEGMDVSMLVHYYRLTKRPAANPHSFWNRERIWKSARQVARLLESPVICYAPPVLEPPSRETDWVRIAGMERPPERSSTDPLEGRRPIAEACRILKAVELEVGHGPLRIGVAFADAGIWDYITGVRVVNKDGTEKSAGHGFSNEVVWTIDEFHGFNVAVSHGGIRALQVVGANEVKQPWAGTPHDLPTSRRLVTYGRADIIKVWLDAYKVTGIAVLRADELAPNRTSLRSIGIWYPQIPNTSWYLNELSFSGYEWAREQDVPMAWIRFGGSGGKRLKDLIGIKSQAAYGRLYSLEFVYGEGVPPPDDDLQLGRCDPAMARFGELFEVDGPGGETIKSVEIALQKDMYSHISALNNRPRIKALAIVTSRGRRMSCGVTGHDKLEPIAIIPGTTITGLYGHTTRLGISSLGVISERVNLPQSLNVAQKLKQSQESDKSQDSNPFQQSKPSRSSGKAQTSKSFDGVMRKLFHR